MSDPIRVLLADDHELFLKGLAGLLRERKEFRLVGEARSGPEAAEMAKSTRPDVAILDVNMPRGGGVGAVAAIKRETDARVIMLTVSDKDDDLLAAIDAGADGYLLKSLAPEQLYSAIVTAAAGQGVLSPEITGKVMKAASAAMPDRPAAELSPRESEVLHLVAEGLTTPQIAKQLVLAESTIKTHLRHIMRKLEASNRAEAVARASAQGLLSPSA